MQTDTDNMLPCMQLLASKKKKKEQHLALHFLSFQFYALQSGVWSQL